jgi:RND family efflux transporter MFP subunit
MVARGERVQAGAPVFSVSSPHLAQLRSELQKAKVVQVHARTTFERVQSLSNAGVTPRKELVTAKEALEEANLAVGLARQKLDSLRVGTEGDATFTVMAPRDGVVVEHNLAVGQEVDASSGTVVAIADLSMVWVVADLFEDDVGTLAAGDKAKVIVGAVELEGIIDQISSIVDRERHTVPVRVKLPNPKGLLRPNAYAQIRFFDTRPAKAEVPASAVMSDGAHCYVYVQELAGVLKRRDIVAGRVTDGKVAVLDGLSPGDQIVMQGAILLDNQIQLDN